MKAVASQSALAVLGAFLMGLMLYGCVSHEPKVDPFFDKWRLKAEKSEPYSPTVSRLTGQETSAAGGLPAALASGQGGPGAEGETGATQSAKALNLPKTKLSVRFIDDDLATSLRTLAVIAHQNILISPSIKGKLNLQTQDTPWDTVFMGIINSYGLTVVKKDNLLYVMSMDDLKQQVEQETLQAQKQQLAGMVTRVVPIEFSDPKAVAESVTPMLSKDKDGKPRGSATVDQHSRSLVVRETPEAIDSIVSLISDLDKPTPQILIEAHIVETTKDVARELGVQWGAFTPNGIHGDSRVMLTPGGVPSYSNAYPVPVTVPPQTMTVLTPGAAPSYTNGQLTFNGVLSTPGAAGAAANVLGNNVNLAAGAINSINPASIGVLVNGGDAVLSAELSALQQDGKLNILSSPSIATLDNSEAVIESGESVPVQTTSSTSSGTQTTTEYKDATLNLTVTPHVITDQAIKLNIKAKKDEVDLTHNVAGNPYIIKKLAQTQLIVENNSTIVLAGLSKETQSGAITGVPGLKDVPGLGWLFKKDSSTKHFEELLIFITPKILTKPKGQAPAEERHEGP